MGKHAHETQKLMRAMKGARARKMMRQMEAMKGQGGFPEM